MRQRVGIAVPPVGRAGLKLVESQPGPESVFDAPHHGIESCDAAAAVGLDPNKSQLQLWTEKTRLRGVSPRADAPIESGPLYWQRILETLLAAYYTRRTGNRLRRVHAMVQHPFEPWMLAQIAWEVVGDTQVQLLECRVPSLQNTRLWRDGLPLHVHLQMMHRLTVTGKGAADVAVLLGGQEFSVYRIERNESVIGHLVQLEGEFWQMVQKGVPPPADATDSAEQALRRLYPRNVGRRLLFADAPYLEDRRPECAEASDPRSDANFRLGFKSS